MTMMSHRKQRALMTLSGIILIAFSYILIDQDLHEKIGPQTPGILWIMTEISSALLGIWLIAAGTIGYKYFRKRRP